jgi:hypothetical protein
MIKRAWLYLFSDVRHETDHVALMAQAASHHKALTDQAARHHQEVLAAIERHYQALLHHVDEALTAHHGRVLTIVRGKDSK